MLQILRHAGLPHELYNTNECKRGEKVRYSNLVPVTIHPCESANMRKDILQGISKLEGIINIPEAVLNVGVHHYLR